MAAFCHFWRITPAEFWDLDVREYQAMLRYMDRWQDAQPKHRHPRRG